MVGEPLLEPGRARVFKEPQAAHPSMDLSVRIRLVVGGLLRGPAVALRGGGAPSQSFKEGEEITDQLAGVHNTRPPRAIDVKGLLYLKTCLGEQVAPGFGVHKVDVAVVPRLLGDPMVQPMEPEGVV